MNLANLAARLETVAVRQANVHQHHVRLQTRGLFDCGRRGASLTDYFNSVVPAQQGVQSKPHDFVVVHYQQTHGLGFRLIH